jgi:hypothetical protein
MNEFNKQMDVIKEQVNNNNKKLDVIMEQCIQFKKECRDLIEMRKKIDTFSETKTELEELSNKIDSLLEIINKDKNNKTVCILL